MISIRTNLLWRPGIALGVTQRQPAFKLIHGHLYKEVHDLSRDMLNHELPSLSPVYIEAK